LGGAGQAPLFLACPSCVSAARTGRGRAAVRGVPPPHFQAFMRRAALPLVAERRPDGVPQQVCTGLLVCAGPRIRSCTAFMFQRGCERGPQNARTAASRAWSCIARACVPTWPCSVFAGYCLCFAAAGAKAAARTQNAIPGMRQQGPGHYGAHCSHGTCFGAWLRHTCWTISKHPSRLRALLYHLGAPGALAAGPGSTLCSVSRPASLCAPGFCETRPLPLPGKRSGRVCMGGTSPWVAVLLGRCGPPSKVRQAQGRHACYGQAPCELWLERALGGVFQEHYHMCFRSFRIAPKQEQD